MLIGGAFTGGSSSLSRFVAVMRKQWNEMWNGVPMVDYTDPENPQYVLYAQNHALVRQNV